jgi:hypothetical protein
MTDSILNISAKQDKHHSSHIAPTCHRLTSKCSAASREHLKAEDSGLTKATRPRADPVAAQELLAEGTHRLERQWDVCPIAHGNYFQRRLLLRPKQFPEFQFASLICLPFIRCLENF